MGLSTLGLPLPSPCLSSLICRFRELNVEAHTMLGHRGARVCSALLP
jgi:hypothetical protein